MLPNDRIWHSAPGADDGAIQRLVSASPVELPDEYLNILIQTNGGEGPLAVQPFYFQIDPADVVYDALKERQHKEFFPGFIIIGSNGGGEYIAFDVRASPPWPIVAIDMTNSDLTESVLAIAPCFEAFLDLIGRECLED